MPFRRRGYRKRPAYKRRSMYHNRRRTFFSPRTGTKSFSRKTYFYKQYVNGVQNLSLGAQNLIQTTTDQNFVITFQLGDCPQYSTFTDLYDQFKILKVVMKLMPMCMQTVSEPVSTSGALTMNLLATVYDFSDDTPLSGVAAYEQYQTFKFQSCNSQRAHTRIIRPAVALSTVAVGGAGNAVMFKAPWQATNIPSVKYFGIKLFLGAAGATTVTQVYYVQFLYYLAFKSVV